MLRITIYERPQETSLLIEGKLAGLWVKALEKYWEIVSAAEPFKATLVTLAVTAVDSDGRELLTRMRRQGVRLEVAGVRRMDAVTEEVEMEELPWA
jgi:DNA-binding response OmpR family regulator